MKPIEQTAVQQSLLAPKIEKGEVQATDEAPKATGTWKRINLKGKQKNLETTGNRSKRKEHEKPACENGVEESQVDSGSHNHFDEGTAKAAKQPRRTL